MDSSDTSGLAGSVLIYMSAIIFSLGVLAVPIYFITGPIVITNDGAPTLTRVVTQPLVAAADDSSPSNTKVEAARKAEVKRTQSPRNRPVAAKTHSQSRVASDAPAALPPATYPNFAPL
jgi:hypothetical protein